jgi:hypothetical protein
MKKCVGLVILAMLGSGAWAGAGDIGLGLFPANPVCNQNIQLKIDMSMQMNCGFKTELCPSIFGSCMVDVFEDCDGCNRQCMPQKISCDLGRNLCAGQHMVWVYHYINPCQNPKCMRCRCFPARNRPQLFGMNFLCFNVCNLKTSGFWSMRP